MELLSPAGNREALTAAVKGGANAVYLGLTALNARKGAGNFAPEALCEAVDFCHERNVRVYVTVNTLVKDAEFALLEEVALSIARAGADGAIVQDVGVAAALSQMLPSLPLHASTQMAVHNVSGVRALKKRGFVRAVLARELTFAEIAQCADEGLEIEVFGHGALCVSCSGQCLFSSLVGGRSGNRGQCAQPCRLPYRLTGPGVEFSGNLLSPKDLMLLPLIPELEKAGATSLKLEGRLKGPDYVYAVTRVYRQALDGETPDSRALLSVFNRGYTPGYGPGVKDSELMSVEETHVLPSDAPPPEPPDRAVALTGHLTVQTGRHLRLFVSDGVREAEAVGPAPQIATGKGADKTRLLSQIQKTGGTPYVFTALTGDIDAGAFVRISDVNELRRDALAAIGRARIEEKRGCDAAILPLEALPEADEQPAVKPRLCVQSANGALLEKALAAGAEEIVYAPLDLTDLRPPQAPFDLALPMTLTDADLSELNRWANARAGAIRGTLVSNIAHLSLNWPGEIRADFPMNVFNARTVRALSLPYTPSVELTAAEIRALPGEKELIVYGRLPLMTLRHCPLNARLGKGRHDACRRCDGAGPYLKDCVLTDRMGAVFPLERLKTSSGCIVRVRNSVPLMLLRRIAKLPAAARWRMIFTTEAEPMSLALIRLYRAALDGADFRLDPAWAQVDAAASTTGHYFRGVDDDR